MSKNIRKKTRQQKEIKKFTFAAKLHSGLSTKLKVFRNNHDTIIAYDITDAIGLMCEKIYGQEFNRITTSQAEEIMNLTWKEYPCHDNCMLKINIDKVYVDVLSILKQQVDIWNTSFDLEICMSTKTMISLFGRRMISSK